MGKVLVVEDDRFLASAYRAKLTKSGFEVQVAGDGEEGLEMLKTFTPDIILLDLVMPRRDGFATLPEIRKLLKDVPVIVTSNLGQKEDLDKTDYLIKSDLSMDALVTKINNAINAPQNT
jgi:DNA-binding response OmpR family regulator